MNKPSTRDAEVATRVKRTAELTGVTERSVYRVLNGDQKNEDVLKVYMTLQEGESLLVQAVKELVPFN